MLEPASRPPVITWITPQVTWLFDTKSQARFRKRHTLLIALSNPLECLSFIQKKIQTGTRRKAQKSSEEAFDFRSGWHVTRLTRAVSTTPEARSEHCGLPHSWWMRFFFPIWRGFWERLVPRGESPLEQSLEFYNYTISSSFPLHHCFLKGHRLFKTKNSTSMYTLDRCSQEEL